MKLTGLRHSIYRVPCQLIKLYIVQTSKRVFIMKITRDIVFPKMKLICDATDESIFFRSSSLELQAV